VSTFLLELVTQFPGIATSSCRVEPSALFLPLRLHQRLFKSIPGRSQAWRRRVSIWYPRTGLRTNVGLLRSTMNKCGLVPSAKCSFGAEEQTTDHILASCPIYNPPKRALGLAAFDDDTVDWLQRTALSI